MDFTIIGMVLTVLGVLLMIASVILNSIFKTMEKENKISFPMLMISFILMFGGLAIANFLS